MTGWPGLCLARRVQKEDLVCGRSVGLRQLLTYHQSPVPGQVIQGFGRQPFPAGQIGRTSLIRQGVATCFKLLPQQRQTVGFRCDRTAHIQQQLRPVLKCLRQRGQFDRLAFSQIHTARHKAHLSQVGTGQPGHLHNGAQHGKRRGCSLDQQIDKRARHHLVRPGIPDQTGHR